MSDKEVAWPRPSTRGINVVVSPQMPFLWMCPDCEEIHETHWTERRSGIVFVSKALWEEMRPWLMTKEEQPTKENE